MPRPVVGRSNGAARLSEETEGGLRSWDEISMIVVTWPVRLTPAWAPRTTTTPKQASQTIFSAASEGGEEGWRPSLMMTVRVVRSVVCCIHSVRRRRAAMRVARGPHRLNHPTSLTPRFNIHAIPSISQSNLRSAYSRVRRAQAQARRRGRGRHGAYLRLAVARPDPAPRGQGCVRVWVFVYMDRSIQSIHRLVDRSIH